MMWIHMVGRQALRQLHQLRQRMKTVAKQQKAAQQRLQKDRVLPRSARQGPDPKQVQAQEKGKIQGLNQSTKSKTSGQGQNLRQQGATKGKETQRPEVADPVYGNNNSSDYSPKGMQRDIAREKGKGIDI